MRGKKGAAKLLANESKHLDTVKLACAFAGYQNPNEPISPKKKPGYGFFAIVN